MAQFTMEEVKTRQVIETEEGAGAQEIVLFFYEAVADCICSYIVRDNFLFSSQ